jgi:eukaryotic-like serine/threonine-protein kinase
VAGGSRFCPSCGLSISGPADDETRLSDSGPRKTSGSRPTTTGAAVWHGRFAPGTVLDNRYRVVSLLGQGGMGEVYRADDLRLEQPVALKFLPESLEMDPARLARFHGEVRTARQVSHPNVCRVYDIGVTDGRHFLSMEYVDGEDLASLLRRIGRLPSDKGVEVARQLCAGLAAAHERGVLHRDLKPANVMIDGAGRVRLTDFGIAGAASTGDDVRAGTPGYMAPEQLAGREVSVRSDVFALGLVLYEVFTGKRAFDAPTIGELVKQHARGAPPTPTSAVPDLDPAIDRTIMRCLESDPVLRPSSALAVAAGLPGASPLEAALAAGETPSPEMVAAAGTTGVLAEGRSLALALASAAFVLLLAFLADRTTVLSKTPPFKDTAVLVDRAEQIAARLGYSQAVDRTMGFTEEGDYLRHVEENDPSIDRWRRIGSGIPPAITFWYRGSPRELMSWQIANEPLFDDPPPVVSDMVRLRLDSAGRLVYFDAVPKQVPEDGSKGLGLGASGLGTDASGTGPGTSGLGLWTSLFQEAGLDQKAFTPTTESWTPPTYADARAAWTGTIGPQSEKVRVEAASYLGRPVYFAIVGPWTTPDRQQEPFGSDRWLGYVSVVILVSSLVAAAIMARSNLKAGRGDRSGVIRLACFVLGVQTIEFLLGTHHVPNLGVQWMLFFRATSLALFSAGMIWLLYLALEPAARRLWPNLLIAWSRLLTGRLRDPMLGRDLLIGLLTGLLATFILRVQYFLRSLAGQPAPDLDSVRLEPLLGLRYALSAILTQFDDAVLTALVLLMLLLGARIALRRVWLAFAASMGILSLLILSGSPKIDVFTVSSALASGGLIMLVLLRLGLLACAVMLLSLNMSTALPSTVNLRAWYFDTALVGFVAFAVLIFLGLRLSQGRAQPA